MPVFISWSGEQSNKVAHQLEKWLELVISMTKPWMSETDIDAGEDWHQELERALKTAKFAIVCLTKNNLESPAIHYEVGFLLGAKKIKVCPFLLDLEISDITWPLDRRQAMIADEQGTRRLLTSINKTLGGVVLEDNLNTLFETFWPKLEAALNKIKTEAEKPASEQVTSISLESGEELIQGMKAMHRKEEEPPKQKPESADELSKSSKTVRSKVSEGVIKRRPRAFTLEVVNPSSYVRKGHVVVPWELIYQATKIRPQNLIVFDNLDNPLPTQVDPGDSDDPARATLLFTLRDPVPVRVEKDPPYLVHAEIGMPPDEVVGESPRIEVENKRRKKEVRRVSLINSRLDVRLELFPKPWDDDKDWYAGSASSVLHDGKEILSVEVDPYNYEKRCMQIDELQLLSPVERLISGEQAIFRQPYQLISQSIGPVRASIKIASAAFDCSYDDPTTQKRISLKCRLYREISLYEGENYIVERLSVQDMPAAAKSDKDSLNHPFEARYFMYADFGFNPNKFHFTPEWLVMNSDWPPLPGYGFAANVPIHTFENPHPDFGDAARRHKTFSWVLSGDKPQECLHLFMHGKFDDLRARVGSAWYEIINQPLRVKVLT